MLRTYIKKKRFTITTYLPILLLLVVLGIFTGFSDSFYQSSLDSEKDVLQKALERSITQCYALEGTYPNDLIYLEDHYGLTYNKSRFFIDYQYIGDNLRPDVTIIER
jgi:hypothetical protein